MAVFQYASEYAHDSLNWAVTEAQKCFNAPLDHTRHYPVDPFPELVNKPTGNPYFDRLLKSDTGLKFMELSDAKSGTIISAGEESLVKPPDAERNTVKEASSNLSVVVVKEDGTHTTCEHSLANVPNEDPLEGFSLEDTLTKRSSPSAVAEAVQSVLQQLAASRVDNESAPKSYESEFLAGKGFGPNRENVSEKHIQIEATFSDSEDEPDKGLNSRAKEEAEIQREQVEARAPDQPPREDVVQPTSAVPSIVRDEVNNWVVGSVLEVFSASANAWYPGVVTQVVPAEGALEMLTVQFWPSIDDSKQKTACRESTQFAPIGAHCGDRLPPGFELVFSKSRPGVFVFLDGTTGLKYDKLDLIWAVHFQRWLDRPVSVGLETISSVAPPIALAPTTKQVSEAKENEFGLATQIVLPRENLAEAPSCENACSKCDETTSRECDQDVARTLRERLAETTSRECDQDVAPAALFLEAMAFESPGAFSATSTAPQSNAELQQSLTENATNSAVNGATLEQAETPKGMDVLTEALLTDEFFASLPEPCDSPSKHRNLTNVFSGSSVSEAGL